MKGNGFFADFDGGKVRKRGCFALESLKRKKKKNK